MKFKVTVELEEGVKQTCERQITTERVLMDLFSRNNFYGGEDYAVKETMFKEAAAGAEWCMASILSFLKANGMVLTREVIKSDGPQKECLVVKDIDEAKLFLETKSCESS